MFEIQAFPAISLIINLYKQKVDDIANFPRVTRKDFFSLVPGQSIPFPDNIDTTKVNQVPIPLFDAIISNFPFVQQEDMPNEILNTHFKATFAASQVAFMKGNKFSINERSDYYVYCFYQSLRFLKDDGMLAAITSNAWLGKNYGIQFKKFLLDNFHIKYIVRSNAEHWFKDSKVSTIFITLQRGRSNSPAKFITLNTKLADLFAKNNLQDFENFYTDIETCTNPNNLQWFKDNQYIDVFNRKDGSIRTAFINRTHLEQSLITKENWGTYFVSQDPLSLFAYKLINPYPNLYDSHRGTKTRSDKMHIVSNERNKTLQIESRFLLPILKNNTELTTILYNSKTEYNFFICDLPEATLKANYPNAYKHIKSFEQTTDKKGVLLPKSLGDRKPYWYTLSNQGAANIFISINPDKRLFFSYSQQVIFSNQRLANIITTPLLTPLLAALLNSVVSLIIVELNGTSRNLGALDLNADFFKTKMKILEPSLLTDGQKSLIIKKFDPLSKRPILSYEAEYLQADRIEFDKAVLRAFGYDIKVLPQLYTLLTETIRNRVELTDR